MHIFFDLIPTGCSTFAGHIVEGAIKMSNNVEFPAHQVRRVFYYQSKTI